MRWLETFIIERQIDFDKFFHVFCVPWSSLSHMFYCQLYGHHYNIVDLHPKNIFYFQAQI